jgi:predicted O-methyltransferase YrrM
MTEKDMLDILGPARQDMRLDLFRAASDVPTGGLIVEIGVHAGDSSIAMACALQGKAIHIIAIDPVYRLGYLEEYPNWRMTATNVLNRLADIGLDGYITLVSDFSWNVLQRWDGRKIDLLHIDGDHRTEAVYKDCGFMKHLKSFGIVLFDDWGDAKTSAERYVAENPPWDYFVMSSLHGYKRGQ